MVGKLVAVLMIVLAALAAGAARSSKRSGKSTIEKTFSSKPPRTTSSSMRGKPPIPEDVTVSTERRRQKLHRFAFANQIDKDPFPESVIGSEVLNVGSSNIYSYDDYSYHSSYDGGFESILPECYFPTPTNYIGLQYCYGHSSKTSPPPCVSEDDLVFNNVTGSFSADQTFYNCMANIPDVASLPTFYNGKYHGCLSITTQLTLLNLVHIDEVQGIAELQLIIDFYWLDKRYNMPLFWDNVPFSYSGFDLTTILTNQSTVLWRPEIVFPDAESVNVMSETLTLQSTDDATVFLYEMTVDLILVQPGFNFRRYPNDAQDLVVRFSALNYDAQQLQLFPSDIACSYLPSGECSFSSNPIWIWKNEPSFSSCTAYPDQKASLIYPAFVYYTIKIVRQGDGIIVRLVLPLTLLLLISALTFWVSYENRVDTTITLLLSVSALYIIILQSIPLVGYLTDIDKFVFWMFLLLCFVVAMHQAYATLFEKTGVWPMRILYLRLIELVGRCFVPPAIIFYFIKTISFGGKGTRVAMIATVVIGVSVLFVREVFGVRAAYYKAIEGVVEKFNRPQLTTKEISKVEIAVLNFYFFRKFSTSLEFIAKEISEKGDLYFEKPTSIMLKNLSSLANVMSGTEISTKSKSQHDSLKTDGSFLRRVRNYSNDESSEVTAASTAVEMTAVYSGDGGVLQQSSSSSGAFTASYGSGMTTSNDIRHREPSVSATSPMHPLSSNFNRNTHIDSDDEDN